MDDLWRFAKAVAISGLAPKGLEKPEAIMIAVQMGAELGLKPMQSLQNIAVINGRPAVWGDAMLGICRASGLFDESAFREEVIEGEGDKEGMTTARCTVRRLPDGNPHTVEFTTEDAARAELLKKKGPWQQYPKRMLQLRARGFALRDQFTDLLRGLKTVEEVQDYPVEVEIEPRQVTRLDDISDELEGENNG